MRTVKWEERLTISIDDVVTDKADVAKQLKHKNIFYSQLQKIIKGSARQLYRNQIDSNVVVGSLLKVPAPQGGICSDKLYVLPHWDRSCRSNMLSHPVTVYWHQANQFQSWPYDARRLTG